MIILILIPFLASILMIFGILSAWFNYGISGGETVLLILLGLICGGLGYKLVEIIRKKDFLIKYPNSEKVPIEFRRFQTRTLIITTYIVLAAMGLALFNIRTIKHWVGIGFFIIGASLTYFGISSLVHAKEINLDLSKDFTTKLIDEKEKVLSIRAKFQMAFILSLIFLAIIVTSFFFFTPGSNYFSLYDYFGFLFFLLGYGFWFVLRK